MNQSRNTLMIQQNLHVVVITLLMTTSCCVADDSEFTSLEKIFVSPSINASKCDVGIVVAKRDEIFQVLLENRHKHTLTIESTKASCGCAVATPESKVIKSNEKARIFLRTSPKSGGPINQKVTLRFKENVEPYVIQIVGVAYPACYTSKSLHSVTATDFEIHVPMYCAVKGKVPRLPKSHPRE